MAKWTTTENFPMKEQVDHPDHYNQGGIECIEALESVGIAEDFCRASAIKYLWRLGLKDKSLQEAKKAAWYVNKLIQLLEKKEELMQLSAKTEGQHPDD